VNSTTTRHAEADPACAEAVDLARGAAQEESGPEQVGPHVGIQVEGDRIVTHLFTSLSPAYVGWRWAVTVARAARSKVVTVSESLLLPGPDSLLAPPWVPWTERVRPGDLKAGDLMPASSDDERLVPVVAIAGDTGLLDWEESESWTPGAELVSGGTSVGADLNSDSDSDFGGSDLPGLGAEPGSGGSATPGPQQRGTAQPRPARARPEGALRPRRVLSATGRDEAAVRWYTGENGPNSPLAMTAPAHCLTCGFLIRLSGPLGRVFGVCANEFAPADGQVVSVDHGCGAHSDGDIIAEADGVPAPAVDELGYDMLNTGATVPESVLETLDHELL
jgi:hypothetical protein